MASWTTHDGDPPAGAAAAEAFYRAACELVDSLPSADDIDEKEAA